MRIYTETTRGKLEPQSARNRAEAWIELTDFCESFRDRVKGLQISTGAPVHSPARAKLMNNLEQQLQDQKKKLNLTPPLKPRPPLG
jgi:hypothetical protein